MPSKVSEEDFEEGLEVLYEDEDEMFTPGVVTKKGKKGTGKWVITLQGGATKSIAPEDLLHMPEGFTAGDGSSDGGDDDDDDDDDAADDALIAGLAGDDDDDAGEAITMCTEADLKKGLDVLAERDGEPVEATVVGPSDKKKGHWKVKFTSDGKVLARLPEDLLAIPISDSEDEDAGPLTAADMVEGAVVMAKRGEDMAQAKVHGPSKKKENMWVLVFEDGKKFPRSLDDMQRV